MEKERGRRGRIDSARGALQQLPLLDSSRSRFVFPFQELRAPDQLSRQHGRRERLHVFAFHFVDEIDSRAHWRARCLFLDACEAIW